jgi:MoaA/NifB/PqqE/SkfB family radical SAM enzyme
MTAALPLAEAAADPAWAACRFLTASVLPVGFACNLRCPFCFSKSSISALSRERSLRGRDVLGYYRFARDRGATRLVITGGGEPLLRPDDVVWLVALGREIFAEVTCFTNGVCLDRALAQRLHDAGLSYLCYSRHAAADADNEALMGPGAPSLDAFFAAAGPLKVRATCVMTRGHVDGPDSVWRYVAALRAHGVREMTFKHTYVAYASSVFQGSREDQWARAHQVEWDPFEGTGEVVGSLPWGPTIRRIEDLQLCYYREPTPAWELANRTGRSTNLLSDGSVYASLEDRQSLLYRLPSS